VRRLLSLLLLLAGSAASSSSSPPPALAGFTPDRAAWEREFEKRLLALPKPEECGELLREITRMPHLAGTEGNKRVADLVAAEYLKAGLEVERPTYDVLLSYPKTARLEVVGESGVRLARPEEPIESDPDTALAPSLPPWCAYSPSADLEAEVVYANHGGAEDYDRLAAMGISARGRIALVRYFGGYRGGKSLEAEKRGVAALLVYSDPVDDGWFQGPVYPDGPWGPPSHVQRGAVVYDFAIPGDPLTPGWASLAGARRIKESESTILPKVPMMPLSARDAAEILTRLRGPAVPSGWQGVAAPNTYRVGPGPVRLHLKIENTREVRTIENVIGVLRGSEEAEKKILLSNHHDAWVYGAVDPSSGTAATIVLARAMGRLAREGWRPRRTIVFGSWDAEEYTLTGSTEWGEEHEADLARNAVACLNVDEATSGNALSVSASPLLFALLRDAAADVPDPGRPGKSVADGWRETGNKVSARSYASGGSDRDALPISVLGSGSDYTVFFNRLGIPSTDLVFDGPYGVYHSVYDDYRWMATQGDPGFLYHAAMARYVGVLALRLANADLYPFGAADYGREIARYADELAKSGKAPGLESDLERLKAQALSWSQEAQATQEALADRLSRGELRGSDAARANDWLLSLERSLLDPDGLPGRFWFRHLIYAPLPSYLAETLPGIREAADAGKTDVGKLQVKRLQERLGAAASAARAARGR
jgi:N-acetylated-alpha-linked acidic dipeptidase